MATVTKKNARNLPDPPFGNVPYGNAAKLHYTFATNSSGVMVDSDAAVAVANADKVVLGVLPAGLLLATALAIISDAFTASTTMDVGFEYVDGEDDADVPQDADYFYDGTSSASQDRIAADNDGVAPVILPKDAFLILTVGGASHASAGQLDIIVDGVLTGRQ